jgi:ferrochelatase
VSFQSRLGRDPWLQPFTDKVVAELPARGVKKLLVICPAFVADCLETLEEIRIRAKEDFLKAGGETFAQIPCVNEDPAWIAVLERMTNDFLRATG